MKVDEIFRIGKNVEAIILNKLGVYFVLQGYLHLLDDVDGTGGRRATIHAFSQTDLDFTKKSKNSLWPRRDFLLRSNLHITVQVGQFEIAGMRGLFNYLCGKVRVVQLRVKV